jgi:hypothetical protein
MEKISWRDIAKDSTGITISGNGVTRRPPKLEVDEAKRLLINLENRGVLYDDLIIEAGSWWRGPSGRCEYVWKQCQTRSTLTPNW